MTIVHMSEKGQIVVPKNIRDERGFGNGSAFAVLETKSGAILFRPVKKLQKWIWWIIFCDSKAWIFRNANTFASPAFELSARHQCRFGIVQAAPDPKCVAWLEARRGQYVCCARSQYDLTGKE